MTGTLRPQSVPSSIDIILVIALMLLFVIGMLSVFDASFGMAAIKGENGVKELFKQMCSFCVGLIGFFTILRVGYQRLQGNAVRILGISFLLLLACYLPIIGAKVNEAHRWVGYGFRFQPSEMAKLALVIYLSWLISTNLKNKQSDIRNFMNGLCTPLVVTGLFALLIEREPDLGTAMVVVLTAITMFYIAGAKVSHLLGALSLCALVVVFIGLFGYRSDRIKNWRDPFVNIATTSLQQAHSLIAVATGQVGGVGFGKGSEKYYLPEQNTDFIFATIAEETGFIGSSFIIGLFLLISWRAVEIARNASDNFGMLLATGIAAMISWQAVINIGVVTGSIPATGVPLPFISFGGTSLVVLMCSCGILLSISAGSRKEGRGYDQLEPLSSRLRSR